jgi:hypothetical protein
MTIKKIEYLVLDEEIGAECKAVFEPYSQAFAIPETEYIRFMYRVTVSLPGRLSISFPAESYETGGEDIIGFVKRAIEHFEDLG